MTMASNDMRKLVPLKPLPIDFNEEKHEYTWEPTGARLAYSVTEILRVLKNRVAAADDREKQNHLGTAGYIGACRAGGIPQRHAT